MPVILRGTQLTDRQHTTFSLLYFSPGHLQLFHLFLQCSLPRVLRSDDPAESTGWWCCSVGRQRSKGARSFQGQNILQLGHPYALFFSKKLTTFFRCRPQNTGRQRRFTVKIKQIKRSEDMVTFIFFVHTITEAKQYAGRGRAEPGLEPGRWTFEPGHLTWRALV